MARRLTAEERVDKMIRNGGNAVEDVVKGIESMTQTPGQLANKKKDKYRAGVLKALDNGDYEAGNSSYTLTEFQQTAIPKIRDRYASGLAASREKAIRSTQQVMKSEDAIAAGLAGMPSDTDQQNEARMLYNLREKKKFKLNRSRR